MARENLSNVTIVAKTALLKVNWIFTCEAILEKDLSNVISVIKVLEDKVTLTCMFRDILVIVSLSATNVIKVFHKKLN